MGRVGQRQRVVEVARVDVIDESGHQRRLVTLACGHHILRRPDGIRPLANCGHCRPGTSTSTDATLTDQRTPSCCRDKRRSLVEIVNNERHPRRTPMEIEFTDRYGGRAPSWLRACHGDCEAMGYTPIYWSDFDARAYEADHLMPVMGEPSVAERPLWLAAHENGEHGEFGCDGWHFLPCIDCDGTGRVSWLVAVARIPRWIWKGLRFAPFAMRRDVSPDGWSFGQRLGNYLNAAFIADIKAIRR